MEIIIESENVYIKSYKTFISLHILSIKFVIPQESTQFAFEMLLYQFSLDSYGMTKLNVDLNFQNIPKIS